jgi:hypothetical protein
MKRVKFLVCASILTAAISSNALAGSITTLKSGSITTLKSGSITTLKSGSITTLKSGSITTLAADQAAPTMEPIDRFSFRGIVVEYLSMFFAMSL